MEQNDVAVNKKRQSNIELLRIIAMVLIVAHHFSIYSGFDFLQTQITLNRLWIQFIKMGGKIGVNLFILISGYFLVNEKQVKINKLLKLWLKIFLYSIVFYIIFAFVGIAPINFKEAIRQVFPIIYSNWGFASTYFILYLLSPYINKLLTSLDKRSYQKLLILATFLWSVIPTFFNSLFESNNLIWFIYLYSLSGYIKLHMENLKISSKKSIKIALLIIALNFLSVIIFDLIGIKIPLFARNATYFYGYQKPTIILISLFLFIGALKSNIKYNDKINDIASATFGVYLIHENVYMRDFIWKTLFQGASFSNSKLLIPYSILVIAFVFSFCTFIELIRIKILEKHYKKFINNVSNFFENLINKFFNLRIFKL